MNKHCQCKPLNAFIRSYRMSDGWRGCITHSIHIWYIQMTKLKDIAIQFVFLDLIESSKVYKCESKRKNVKPLIGCISLLFILRLKVIKLLRLSRVLIVYNCQMAVTLNPICLKVRGETSGQQVRLVLITAIIEITISSNMLGYFKNY